MKGKRLETQAQWLKEIEPDQNIEGIETAILPDLRARFKKWFHSHVIQPTVALARYNPLTGKYELGPEDRNAHTLAFSTTSAQVTDFVITNGQTWEILWFGGEDQTTASFNDLMYFDGTNEFPLPNFTTAGSATNVGQGYVMGMGPVRLTGNGTIALRYRAVNFVALDAIRVWLVYRRVS